MKYNYKPIDCSYHDVLLSKATLRKVVHLVYTDEKGIRQNAESRIVDVYTRSKEEFAELENGLTIRLDHIVSVDGIIRPESGECII